MTSEMSTVGVFRAFEVFFTRQSPSFFDSSSDTEAFHRTHYTTPAGPLEFMMKALVLTV